MNEPEHSSARWRELIERHLLGQISEDESRELEAALSAHRVVRDEFRRRCNVDAALRHAATALQAETAPPVRNHPKERTPDTTRRLWLQWRPLTAAAAGIVLGMFCTSVVYGFVVRQQAVRVLPLPVFEAGFEKPHLVIGDGEPKAVREWSGERASVVTAENGVTPVEGVRMSRIGQNVPGQPEKMPLARLYQMIDLSTVPAGTWDDEAEVKVEAAFCAADEGQQARFRIRAFALAEPPEDAARDFWPRVHSSLLQDDDLTVSSAQWFPVKPGQKGWHRFSLKLPLPRGTRTLVVLFGAGHARNSAESPNSFYLDDVRVTLLSRQGPLP